MDEAAASLVLWEEPPKLPEQHPLHACVPARDFFRPIVLWVAQQFGGLQVNEAKRLREFEAENAKLKKL